MWNTYISIWVKHMGFTHPKKTHRKQMLSNNYTTSTWLYISGITYSTFDTKYRFLHRLERLSVFKAELLQQETIQRLKAHRTVKLNKNISESNHKRAQSMALLLQKAEINETILRLLSGDKQQSKKYHLETSLGFCLQSKTTWKSTQKETGGKKTSIEEQSEFCFTRKWSNVTGS